MNDGLIGICTCDFPKRGRELNIVEADSENGSTSNVITKELILT